MRIGTVGTGFITNYILDNIEKTDGISCHAVYSRNEDSARRLAEKYHIEKTYQTIPLILFILHHQIVCIIHRQKVL